MSSEMTIFRRRLWSFTFLFKHQAGVYYSVTSIMLYGFDFLIFTPWCMLYFIYDLLEQNIWVQEMDGFSEDRLRKLSIDQLYSLVFMALNVLGDKLSDRCPPDMLRPMPSDQTKAEASGPLASIGV